MYNISKVSSFFKIFFKCLFVMRLAVFIVVWGASILGITPMGHHAVARFSHALFSVTTHLLFLYFVILLFQQYEKGKIFTLENVSIMRNLGIILIVKEVIEVIIALFFPIYHFSILWALTSINFETLLIGALLIFNSWIMRESYVLKMDQQLTI